MTYFYFQPGFDHNLRNHHGDTLLMVACGTGNTDVGLFLLQSAVYPQSFVDDDDYL
jgi:ankyrin repeat protein